MQSDDATPAASGYTEAHVSEALATDPRVATLGIEVSIRAHDVFLSGDVATAERKEAVAEVVAELLPGYTVHNDTSTNDFPPGVETEHLS
ncbi:MAG TPA: BON domain-containing protein [Actinomycetota bacterium]|nr:BON domain-containing protein [Actinomycetota bacterium]